MHKPISSTVLHTKTINAFSQVHFKVYCPDTMSQNTTKEGNVFKEAVDFTTF